MCVMARDDPHFRLRIPEEVKQRIELAAAENRRSINAEIIHRLQTTLEMDAYEPGPNAHIDVQTSDRENDSYGEQLADSTRSLLEALEGVRNEVKETALLTRIVLEAAVENDGKIPDEFLPRARALVTQKIQYQPSNPDDK